MKSQAGVSLEANDPLAGDFNDDAPVDLCDWMDRIDVWEGDFFIVVLDWETRVLVSDGSLDSTGGNSTTGLLGLSSIGWKPVTNVEELRWRLSPVLLTEPVVDSLFTSLGLKISKSNFSASARIEKSSILDKPMEGSTEGGKYGTSIAEITPGPNRPSICIPCILALGTNLEEVSVPSSYHRNANVTYPAETEDPCVYPSRWLRSRMAPTKISSD